QGLEEAHHLVDGADLGAAGDLPGLAEDADRDALVVGIETDVEHGGLRKSLDLGTAGPGVQGTRPTGASLIGPTPKSIGPRWLRSTTPKCATEQRLCTRVRELD